jgi:hypothetical protein
MLRSPGFTQHALRRCFSSIFTRSDFPSERELLKWGLKIAERPITIEEVMAAGRAGTLKEMWGTGNGGSGLAARDARL